MLIGIRSKTDTAPSDLVALLLECHTRIRFFIELARRLGEATELPEDEVRESAHRVRDYFGRALPLHVRDEEDSILPRLRGCDPEVDAALASMHAQHGEHVSKLVALLDFCDQLQAEPARHAELASGLTSLSVEMSRDFHEHLELEERVIFPALQDRLDGPAREAILAELRSRRAPV